MKHFWEVNETGQRKSQRMCVQALGCPSACAILSAWTSFLSPYSQVPLPHPLVPLALNRPEHHSVSINPLQFMRTLCSVGVNPASPAQRQLIKA